MSARIKHFVLFDYVLPVPCIIVNRLWLHIFFLCYFYFNEQMYAANASNEIWKMEGNGGIIIEFIIEVDRIFKRQIYRSLIFLLISKYMLQMKMNVLILLLQIIMFPC